MEDKINQKIKNILNDLRVVHQRSEQFYAKQLVPGQTTKSTDIFDMALAFENEERILIDLQLTYSEKFPNDYTSEQIESLNIERDRLTKRIHAWQNRQFPSQSRD